MTDNIEEVLPVPGNEEISSGNIVYAKTIFQRFSNIFTPLFELAKKNFDKTIQEAGRWQDAGLEVKINKIKNNWDQNPDVANLDNYFTFNYYNGPNKELTELSAALNNLEQNWNDVVKEVRGFDKNRVKPIGGHWSRETGQLPLHLLAPDVVAASGKVRQYDYIAAYNFKGFLEALYAIVSEMRNISFQIYENGTYQKNYSFGKTNKFASYKDLSLVNEVKKDSIPSDTLSALINFNDFILNRNTDGRQVFTPDETERSTKQGKHGYINKQEPLYSSSIGNIIKSNSGFTNTNVNGDYNFGRQTVQHYTKNTSDWNNHVITNTDDPNAAITSFYNAPSRLANQGSGSGEFNYKSDPKTGVAKQYLTVKPGSSVGSGSSAWPKTDSFKTVLSTISTYFNEQNSSASANERIVQSKNALDSTQELINQKKHKVIITAKTVNDLFTDLNKLAVKILATLCGEYQFNITQGGNLPIKFSPQMGLGYPMMFSWYYGGERGYFSLTHGIEHNNNYATNPTSIYRRPPASRVYNGVLNNGLEIAAEDYHLPWGDPDGGEGRNWPIRAGLPYVRTSDNKNIPIKNLNDALAIETGCHSSVVPTTFNRYGIKLKDGGDGPITGFSVANRLNKQGLTFKNKMQSTYILPWNSYTMQIMQNEYTNPSDEQEIARKLVNRYCVAYPLDYAKYYTETTCVTDNNIPCWVKKNVNTKYIFTPYMTWLNHVTAIEKNIFNGKIVNADNTSQNNVSIKSEAGHINMAAGIPVLYLNRPDLWNKKSIKTSNISFNSELSSSMRKGTAQLIIGKTDSNNRITSTLDTTKKNIEIDWFEYIISCSMNINEVTKRHEGYIRTSFGFNSGNPVTVSLNYLDFGHPASLGGPNKVRAGGTGITSKVYHIFNNYNTKSMSGSKAYQNIGMSNMTNDLMDLLYGSRFKFNDFYEEYNPLAKSNLDRSDVKTYFTVGTGNKYVQDFANRNMSWVTHISGNRCGSGDPVNFYIKNWITQATGRKPERYNAAWLSQGNFLCAANLSNKVRINGKIYQYKYVPQPSPINITSIQIFYNGNSSSAADLVPRFKVTGSCINFWNNAKYVDVYLQVSKNNGTSTNLQYRLRGEINDQGRNANLQFNLSRALKEYKLLDENDNEVGEISSSTETGFYTISIDLPLPELLDIYGQKEGDTRECSCTMRFTNENGGWRDVCGNKSTPNINNGYFEINVDYTPKPYIPTYNLLKYKLTEPSTAYDKGTADVSGSIYQDGISSIIIPTEISDSNYYYNVTDIESNIFPDLPGTNDYVSKLKYLAIPSTVTSIHSDAFDSLTALNHVQLPVYDITMSEMFGGTYQNITACNLTDELTENKVIIASMFEGCTALTGLTIPDTISSIESSAFSGCQSLRNIVIPPTVTSLGDSIFNGCTNIKTINLPEEIETMGSSVFQNCTSLISVTYPTAISTINNSTFKDCSSLVSVELNNDITAFEVSSFYGCSDISTIDFPDNLKSIGSYAFKGCSNLEEITIPTALRSFIGTDAFSGCTDISTIYYYRIEGEETSADVFDHVSTILIDAGITDFNHIKFIDLNPPEQLDWTFSIFDETSAEIIDITYPPKHLTIPSRFVTENEYGDQITATVTKINDDFNSYDSISAFDLPNTLRSIGKNSFSDCSSSVSTDFGGYKFINDFTSGVPRKSWVVGFTDTPYIIESIDFNNALFEGINGVADCAFEETDVSAISAGTRLNRIPYGLFRYCKKLKNVDLGSTITAIDEDAFKECSAISSLTIPNNVIHIGDSTFNDCSSMTTCTINSTSKLKSIGNYAFKNCTSLSEIYIPSSITTIGINAFENCINLSNIQFNSDTLEQIPENCFKNCTSLTEITIPDTIREIKAKAFENCSTISAINFNENINAIELLAFNGCNNVTSVTIPNSITELGQGCFANCTELSNFIIGSENIFYLAEDNVIYSKPDGYNEDEDNRDLDDTEDDEESEVINEDEEPTEYSSLIQYPVGHTRQSYEVLSNIGSCPVQAINGYAFSGCTNLTSITIPSSIMLIGESAFEGCSEISEVSIQSLDKWLNILFANETANPLNSNSKLILDGEIVEHLNSYPGGITSIKPYVFANYSRLKDVKLTTEISSIESGAFYNCSDLSNVTIQFSSVELEDFDFRIGESAFENCESINEIHINDLNKWCKISFENLGSNPIHSGSTLYLDDSIVKDLSMLSTEISTINGYTFANYSKFKALNFEGVTSIGEYAFAYCSELSSLYIPSAGVNMDISSFVGCNALNTIYFETVPDETSAETIENIKENLRTAGLSDSQIDNISAIVVENNG